MIWRQHKGLLNKLYKLIYWFLSILTTLSSLFWSYSLRLKKKKKKTCRYYNSYKIPSRAHCFVIVRAILLTPPNSPNDCSFNKWLGLAGMIVSCAAGWPCLVFSLEWGRQASRSEDKASKRLGSELWENIHEGCKYNIRPTCRSNMYVKSSVANWFDSSG